MMMRRMILAAMVAGALSITASARGADTTQSQEASALFDEGVRLMNAGDYEHARVKFLASNGLGKSSTNLWNLGYCEVQSGHYAEGARHIRQYLHLSTAEPKYVKIANDELLPKALASAGQIQLDARDGVIVTLDGKDAIGVAPFVDPVAVAAGTHHVEARLGQQVTQQDLQVGPGQLVTVHVFPAVTALGAPPAPASGTLRLASPPPSVPDADTESKGGSFWTTRKVITLGLGLGAVAALGTAVGFGAESQNQTNKVNSLQSSCASGCADLSNARDSQRQDAQVADVLFVAGGILAAGSVAVLTSLLVSPDRRSAQAIVYPLVLNGGGGLAVHAPF
jgi:hypothetical protein